MRYYAISWALLSASCLLQEAAPPHRLSGERIVAVVADPAEVAPGDPVQLRAIVASPAGPVLDARVHWSLCRSPRPLSENGAVSSLCASDMEEPLPDVAQEISATMPDAACARFGPETSLGQRPADPDASGGYYQPFRLELALGDVAIERLRVRCALTNAPLAVVQEFAERYRTNEAPGIVKLTIDTARDGALTAQTKVTLRLWAQEEAAETYVAYNPAQQQLEERSEALSVSWLVSAGELDALVSDVSDLGAVTRWTLPAQTGPVYAWAVLRDDRGGISVAVGTFEVTTP